jgi:aromatic ring-opening dioxygenase catalytic subunit (LigB family)
MKLTLFNFREEGILILSGGLTAHNLRDRVSFAPDSARPIHKEFDEAIHKAIEIESVCSFTLNDTFE